MANSANSFDLQNGVLDSPVADALYSIVGGNNEFNSAQAQLQRDFQRQQNAIAMDFNALEAQKNRDWQELMSNTAHQREVRDLLNAGLNPVLSASGGNGAAVGTGAVAQGVTSSGAKASADTSLVNGLIGLVGSAMSYNATVAAASISSGAAVQAAQIAAEAAQARLQQELDWKSDHPSNSYQVLGELVKGLTGDSIGSSVTSLMDKLKGSISGIFGTNGGGRGGSTIGSRLGSLFGIGSKGSSDGKVYRDTFKF